MPSPAPPAIETLPPPTRNQRLNNRLFRRQAKAAMSALPPRPKPRRILERPGVADAVLTVVVLIIALVYVGSAGGNFALDDGWIHQTYARNLGLRGEWSFVPGVPSTASTSPLYTVLLSIGYRIGVDGRLWAHLLGAIALLLTGIVGVRMMRHLLPNAPNIALLAGLALVGAWHLVWSAFSGMETAIFNLFTLLVVWAIWRDAEAAPNARTAVWRGVRFGIVAGLTTLTRVEGVLLVGMAGLALLASRRWPLRWWLVYGVSAALVFALVLAPYVLFNYSLTGALLPNTAAAKREYALNLLVFSYPERLLSLLQPLMAGGQLLLIPGVCIFVYLTARRLQAEPRLAPTLLIVLWPLALLMLYAAWLPFPYQHARYVIPALPAFILAGVAGIAWALARWRRGIAARVVLRALALSCVLVFIAFLAVIGLRVYVTDVGIINQEQVGQAQYIARNVPTDELLVLYDIGAVGYFAPRSSLLDVAGLISPEMIPYINNRAAMWPIIRERGGRWMMAIEDQIPRPLPDDVRLCIAHQTPDDLVSIQGLNPMIVYRIQYNGQVCSPGEPETTLPLR